LPDYILNTQVSDFLLAKRKTKLSEVDTMEKATVLMNFNKYRIIKYLSYKLRISSNKYFGF